MEEDPSLTFKVQELMILGILYCKATPRARVKKFYDLLQPGLEDSISAGDYNIEYYILLMANICYTAVISLFNQIHKDAGDMLQCREEWLPYDDMEAVTAACNSLYDDDVTGFVERVFDTNSRISQAVFKQVMFEKYYDFLQPHRIRALVYFNYTSVVAERIEDP